MILRVFNRESFKSSLLEQEKLFTKKIGLLLLPFQNKFSKMHIYTYIYIYIHIFYMYLKVSAYFPHNSRAIHLPLGEQCQRYDY